MGDSMNDIELRKLNRKSLLEILLEQTKRIEELEIELEKTKKQLKEKKIKLNNIGSLAEASLVLSDIFKAADEAIEIQMKSINAFAKEEENRVKKELRAYKKKKKIEIENKLKKEIIQKDYQEKNKLSTKRKVRK